MPLLSRHLCQRGCNFIAPLTLMQKSFQVQSKSTKGRGLLVENLKRSCNMYETIPTYICLPLSPLPVSVFKMFVFPTAAAQSLLLHFEMTRFHLNAVSRSFAKICMVHIVADTDWSYGLESFMQGTVFDFSNFVSNINSN